MIECVPNVSEGRRRDVLATLSARVRAVAGARLLDVSADPSHHRAVFTMAGSPEGMEAAVLALVEAALAAIDLRVHRGAHPRFGAVDLVPFVPLADAGMPGCITLARRTGEAIAARFDLPVFLYGHAAAAPARRRLSDVRQGGFESLAARLADPAWAPDYGPARPHPTAGAVAVGARPLLVAFNVNLATDRLDVARRIAARVRERDGGLPSVLALGLPLAHRGVVQVSMNLTDVEVTTVAQAFDAVVREAANEGVVVLESEIVGLAPEAALAGTSPAALKLRGFTAQRLLEVRLREEGLI